MARNAYVTISALLLVVGGLWFERSVAGAQSTPETDATTEQSAPPEGMVLIEPVSEDRRLTFDAPEQVLEEGNDYLARLVTSKGPILIDLFEDRTPVTVNNFVFLSLNRYYDGVPFHRVLEDFMAQTGDPTGTGRGGPGYTFEDEIDPELRHDSRGTVSMANAGPGTNGSQFFITFTATPWLDGAHTVFGEVVAGGEVLDDLTRVDPSTPNAVLRLDAPIGELADQGIELDGPGDRPLREHLEEKLGAVPAMGQTFSVDGYLAVVGRSGNVPAAGFFPVPDTLERVEILVREPGTSGGE